MTREPPDTDQSERTQEADSVRAAPHDGAPDGESREVIGRLLSVNVGTPKNVDWRGRTVFTGVFKDPVVGPRRVRSAQHRG